MMSIFQTCEARVCQSVHTEGRDPRLQLLVVVSAAERAFCKPYSAAPQHMQGQCIHSLKFEGSSLKLISFIWTKQDVLHR